MQSSVHQVTMKGNGQQHLVNVDIMYISPITAGTVKISPLASNNALAPFGGGEKLKQVFFDTSVQ